MRITNIFCAFLLLSLLSCRSGAPESAKNTQVEAYTPDANAVAFDIEPVRDSKCPNGNTCFSAKFERKGTVAKFRIEFEPSPRESTDEFITAFGKGRIVAVEGSNSNLLLQALKTALEAKTLPSRVQRKPYVTFEYVELGNRNSHASEGGLNADPPGDWSANKLFFGDDQGEVFVNLNPALKKGEFSIKDPDYGDFLVAELAKVL